MSDARLIARVVSRGGSTLAASRTAFGLSLALGIAAACTTTPSSRDEPGAGMPRDGELRDAPPEGERRRIPLVYVSRSGTSSGFGAASTRLPAPEPPAEAARARPFDVQTATGARIRVIRVYRRGWVPCGVVHCVGAVLVEVLGEAHEGPAPQLVLELSCPVDFGWPHASFEPGAELTVRLYRTRQPWPRVWGVERLPHGVPTRQVAALWPSGV